MEDEDEVDVLGDFCLNLETDVNHYDAAEFPAQNSELLGDYMQHPWLLENSQVWYFDHSTDDKNKTTLDSMLHEEKKHFPCSSNSAVAQTNPASVLSVSKVSPLWTKEDIDSLIKGISLHRHNWSKVARTVGTKTTLQVKSYIKSHPELISSQVHLTSITPSPPQYISEVEIANDNSAGQFSVDEIVNEAEIPATMEEVIATVTTTSNSWSMTKNPKTKKSNHPTLNYLSKNIKRGKGLTQKKIPGRPKKLMKDNQTKNVPLIPPASILSPVKKVVPVLEGEIIRLQKDNGLDDSKSDSEVDIDGDDDNPVCVIPKREVVTVAGTKVEEEKQETKDRLVSSCEKNIDSTLCATRTEISQELPESKPSESKVNKPSECETFDVDFKCSDGIPLKSTPDVEPQPVFTFPVPVEESNIDLTIITDEEKTIHWDFFEGRPSKTPERYMKIRNSIVLEWRRVKPRYLTKTSVRPSLKNCGDVNCISRIHAYLELTGVVNFGCDQVQYDRSLPPVPSHRERVANSVAPLVNQPSALHGLLARARKKRQLSLENCDENGGYTITHDGSQIQLIAEGSRAKARELKKISSQTGDPFQLVPCANFSADKQAPFAVKISMQALIVIDIHSHLCTTEVIGLLGGHFYSGSDDTQAILFIEAAQPCRSQATNHQCEMCPVSQTEGNEALRSRGLDVVGWYHSHPTFPALPSLRDLHTQNEFQQWFSRQDAPFIGLIVNPFSTSGIKSSLSLKSMMRCITVHDDQPYKHELSVENESNNLEEVTSTLNILETLLESCPTLVPLDCNYPYLPSRPSDGVINYAKKIICSLRAHLESTIDSKKMAEIETLTEEFLDRVITFQAKKATAVQVLANEH